MLPYISECENCQGIALLEKFPHCPRDIIQGFYYTPFKKVEDVTISLTKKESVHGTTSAMCGNLTVKSSKCAD